MERDELLRRYALALSLVADSDLAGDLFMDARDEADLVRRANRWRERSGVAPADPGAPLPALTADQEAHALHLARRARLRRQYRWLIGAACGLAVAAVGALLLHTPASPVRAKPVQAPRQVDPSFALAPVSMEAEGLHVVAYKAETTPGTVTVTWGVHWAGLEPVWRPLLVVGGFHPQRVSSVDTEVLSAAPGEVVARSSFRAVAGADDGLSLVIETAETSHDLFLTGMPVVAQGDPPGALTLDVGKSLPVGQSRSVLVESVTLTPEYTALRYALPNPATGAVWPDSGLEFTLEATGQTLHSYGLRDVVSGVPAAERVAYFGPLPLGVPTFRIHLQMQSIPPGGRMFTYHFGDTQSIPAWSRTAGGLSVTVAPMAPDAPTTAFVTDDEGRQYTAATDGVAVVDGQLRRDFRVGGFPLEARPATLTLGVAPEGRGDAPGGFIQLTVPGASSR